MAIMPDTKDWTWVLRRPCPECGFAAQEFPRAEIGAMIRDNAGRWQAVLARPDARVRPDDMTWSSLEYACHVRDVFRLYDERLRLMLTEDDPLYPNWDQDETAVGDRYGEQDPQMVAGELRAAGEHVATRFDGVTDDDWQRTGPTQRRCVVHRGELRALLRARL